VPAEAPRPGRSGRYEASQRELAYRVWVAADGGMAETLRVLDAEHEWPLAKQTLLDWRETYGWQQRRAAEVAEARRRDRAQATDRLAMLAGLDLQIERYEGLFAAGAAAGEMPDARAVSAYAGLMRLRRDLARDLDAGEGVQRLELAMEVLTTIGQLVRERYPQHAGAWLELLEPAGSALADRFG